MGRMKNGKVGFAKQEKTEPNVGTDVVTERVENVTMAENDKASTRTERMMAQEK